ncbi:MAG TPA: hypothetical protein VGF67_03910 [Ktedonobacteraceae bacterium]
MATWRPQNTYSSPGARGRFPRLSFGHASPASHPGSACGSVSGGSSPLMEVVRQDEAGQPTCLAQGEATLVEMESRTQTV